MDEHHRKTQKHVKRVQVLTISAIVINVIMFLAVYGMLTAQMSILNSRVNSLSSDVQELDSTANTKFGELSEDMVSISGNLQENAETLNLTNLLLEELGLEIEKVDEENAAIRSELNYTGTINEALDSIVLIIWTDKSSVIGSGFIVSEDGYVLTAEHVIEEFEEKTVRVKTRDGKIHVATVEGRDEGSDVAVLKIDLENLTYLEFRDMAGISPGGKVFALGAPEGFAFSASEGIVGAVRSVDEIKDEVGIDLGLDKGVYVIQTDAAITHGNSGGPLIDNSGMVIGLNSFGISRSSSGVYMDVEGLNFAIASNDVKSVYEGFATKP